MKLKPIVASIAVIATAGLAANAMAAVPQSANTRAQLAAMSAQVAKMDAVLDQNQSGVLASQPSAANDWFKRITITGLLNVDASLSSRAPVASSTSGSGTRFASGSSSDISVSNATLFIDAVVNRWVKAHIALNYNDGGIRTAGFGANNSGVTLDEAYATIADFAKYPVYFRAGREYTPFGTYNRYPITKSLTQLLEQTQATVAQVGFVAASGFSGSVYAFRGTREVGKNPRVNNFGAQIAYANNFNNVSVNANVGYVYNMLDANYIASALPTGGYTDRVGGLAVHVGAKSGPFDGAVDYVTALRDTSTTDLTFKGKKAQPYAVGVDVGYSFPVMGRDSRVNLGFQHSGEAANVGLTGMPENRYLIGYNVEAMKNVNLGFQVYHDSNYSRSERSGGAAAESNSTTGVIRLGVNLA